MPESCWVKFSRYGDSLKSFVTYTEVEKEMGCLLDDSINAFISIDIAKTTIILVNGNTRKLVTIR